MKRVSGTHDAKSAWWHLRGPYLLGYVSYLWFAIVVPPRAASDGGPWWVWVAATMGVLLLAGSISSWMVVSNREPKDFWKKAETLEVSALRVASGFELAFGALSLLQGRVALPLSVVHFLIGFLLLGVLSNLTWHKGKSNALRN